MMMEQVQLGGRLVAGFALGESIVADTGAHLPSTVNQVDTTVNGAMDALNTVVTSDQCKDKIPQDVAIGWSTFYSAWQSVHAQWTPYAKQLLGSKGWDLYKWLSIGYPSISGLIPSWPTSTAWQLYQSMFTGIYDEMIGFYSQLTSKGGWQDRISALCPNYKPPPVTPLPPSPSLGGDKSDWATRLEHAAEAVGVTAIILVTAYGVYKVVQILK